MNTLKLKPIATFLGACALSLVSVAGFAAGGRMGGGPVAAPTTRVSAPAPAAKPTAAAAKTTTQAHATGQPNQSCGSATAPNTPGNSASAPGSAFNPDGKAGTVYAGQQPQNSKNPNSVSQYDVACSKQPH